MINFAKTIINKSNEIIQTVINHFMRCHCWRYA